MTEQQTPPVQAPTNPLLERIKLPGETFTLPSGGLFYDESILDPSAENGEVHIHPMTTIDEVIMKTPDMLFSGNAVKEVFGRCIPQIRNTNKLLAKDVDFLLTCLRKISYGDEMQVEYTHDCKDAKSHTYLVNVSNFVRNAKRIDPTTITKNFSVTLENAQVVRIHPIRFGEFVSIMQSLDTSATDMTPEEGAELLVNSMADVIESVDEITDRQMIHDWLIQVPPSYISKINKTLEATSDWGPDFHVSVKCKDCGADVSFNAPMNPLSFFT